MISIFLIKTKGIVSEHSAIKEYDVSSSSSNCKILYHKVKKIAQIGAIFIYFTYFYLN